MKREQRNAQRFGVLRGCSAASVAPDPLDIGIGSAFHYAERRHRRSRGAAGKTGMHDRGLNKIGTANAEHGGKRAARGHARDENPFCVRAIFANDGFDLRGDNGGFAVAFGGPQIEPVPAVPGIRGFLLARQQDEPTLSIGERRHPRRFDNLFRRLFARVTQHEQRRAFPARPATRNVD